MWYLQEGTSVAEHLKKICVARPRISLDTIPPEIKSILPFLKTTIGAQPDRTATRAGTMEIMAFEEELEWRHTPPELAHTWKFGYGREDVGRADHNQSLAHRIRLESKQQSHPHSGSTVPSLYRSLEIDVQTKDPKHSADKRWPAEVTPLHLEVSPDRLPERSPFP